MSGLKLTRRSANYTAAEVDCLLSYLEANPEVAFAKVGGVIQTPDDYRTAWEVLAEMVTKAGPVGYFGAKRTGQEVKRKWHDMKSRVRAKVAAIGKDIDKFGYSSLKLSATEERVLAIISIKNDEQGDDRNSPPPTDNAVPALKVFSFQNESSSEDRCRYDSNKEDEGENDETSALNESNLLNELKSGGSEEKKRRLNEVFSAAVEEKRIKRRPNSEDDQLTELCNTQQVLNAELRSIKDILKKCQLSIEKLALLKRAELRLKCAKYGVEFEDLFD